MWQKAKNQLIHYQLLLIDLCIGFWNISKSVYKFKLFNSISLQLQWIYLSSLLNYSNNFIFDNFISTPTFRNNSKIPRKILFKTNKPEMSNIIISTQSEGDKGTKTKVEWMFQICQLRECDETVRTLGHGPANRSGIKRFPGC